MSAVIGVVFFFFNDLYWFCKIFRVRVRIKSSISSFSQPVCTWFKLIFDIFVVLFFILLLWKCVSVSALASQRKISSKMSICRLYILISSFESWKLSRVRSQVLSRTLSMQQILRMRSLEIISFWPIKTFSISSIHS